MMEYRLTPERAEFAKNQLAKNSGWVLAYHADEKNGEYTGASYEYILKNVGLPAHSYVDAPTLPEPGYAIVRSEEGKRWEHLPDHRGKNVFDTTTRQRHSVTEIGELPQHLTFSAPMTEFDVWEGEHWVTDMEAQQAAEYQIRQQDLNARLADANSQIQMLTDAIELEMATEEEKTLLQQWKTYRVRLHRVDIHAADLIWPQTPKTRQPSGEHDDQRTDL